MECDGPSVEDSGKCHEKCTCHPDNKDTSSVETHKSTAHLDDKKGRKKYSHPKIGPKEMNKINHLFTTWMKEEYSGGVHKKTHKGKTLKDERVRFIHKMLNNYQYFRGKEKALMLLQEQQDDLKDQQQHLENLLDKQKDALSSKTGSTHDSVYTTPKHSGSRHSHDDVNITITTSNTTQAPPTTQAPLNQQTGIEIEAIKKQIAEIQKEQGFLSTQQAQLTVQLTELSNEQAPFQQARQLITLLLKQKQGAATAPPTLPPTQSDYGDEVNAEAVPNGQSVQTSGLLNQLQNVLSKLVFTEDGNTMPGNTNDGQQMMFLQRNQGDQSNRMQNENSMVYGQNEVTDQAPSNMYNIPVEMDRSDLNDQGQTNSLFGRNYVDNDSEDDNEMMPSFAMDRGDSDGETQPEFAMMEKKTLHYPNSQVNSPKKGEILKKDKSNAKKT